MTFCIEVEPSVETVPLSLLPQEASTVSVSSAASAILRIFFIVFNLLLLFPFSLLRLNNISRM